MCRSRSGPPHSPCRQLLKDLWSPSTERCAGWGLTYPRVSQCLLVDEIREIVVRSLDPPGVQCILPEFTALSSRCLLTVAAFKTSPWRVWRKN